MKHPILHHVIGTAAVLSLVLIACLAVRADIYKWVDADGVVHFSDQAPAQGNQTTEIEISPSAPPSTYQPTPHEKKEIDDNAKPDEKEATPARPQPSRQTEVALYVTSWCKYCKQARKYLTDHHIPFSEYDIEKDREAAKRRQALDPRPGVPLAVINGKIIIGFSEKSYAWALQQGP